jgi:hypothetical protein
MTRNSRTGILVALALVFGVAAGAVGMLSLRGGEGPYTSSPTASRSMGAASASTAFMLAVAGNCDMAPVLPAGPGDDGRETLQAKPGTASAGEIATLILSGKEAVAAGRQRDAEVDFLNACRNATVLQDADPIPLADAMYQLGRHYANVAALGGAKGRDKELYQRAERLYSASLEAYRARYGEDSEKTHFAREGLITVQQATGGKPPTAIAKAAAPAPAPVAAASEATPAFAAASAASAPVAAASAPAATAAASPASASKETAKAEVHEEHHAVRAARAPEETRSRREATASVEHLPPPSPVRERADARRDNETDAAAPVEESLPRPLSRRAPRRESADDQGDVAVDVAPPPPRTPRRYRPEPAAPVEALPMPDASPPPPDAASSGAGPAPQNDGSPDSP